MIRQQNADEAAPWVRWGVPQAGSYLPVHVLPLPCAAANKDDRHRNPGDVILPNPLENGLSGLILVDDVTQILTDMSTNLPPIISTN